MSDKCALLKAFEESSLADTKWHFLSSQLAVGRIRKMNMFVGPRICYNFESNVELSLTGSLVISANSIPFKNRRDSSPAVVLLRWTFPRFSDSTFREDQPFTNKLQLCLKGADFLTVGTDLIYCNLLGDLKLAHLCYTSPFSFDCQADLINEILPPCYTWSDNITCICSWTRVTAKEF